MDEAALDVLIDAGRSWDAVIDNSGYFPRMVGASAQLLAKTCGQYIFISSISCYDEKSIPRIQARLRQQGRAS